jgi:PadR family transcriptional regulator, regulatory protein PadR
MDMRVVRELLLGLWKVHILHHAASEGVVGNEMMHELRRHGYDISPGTLYPMLRRMEANGWLRSSAESDRPNARRRFTATPAGRSVLETLREHVRELHDELNPPGRRRK